MIDFDALVLGPVYRTFGQTAVLTIESISHEVEVIDYTEEIAVEDGSTIGVQTIRPVVDVRRSVIDGLGIAYADLINGEIITNRATWRVKSFLENGAKLRLILMVAS